MPSPRTPPALFRTSSRVPTPRAWPRPPGAASGYPRFVSSQVRSGRCRLAPGPRVSSQPGSSSPWRTLARRQPVGTSGARSTRGRASIRRRNRNAPARRAPNDATSSVCSVRAPLPLKRLSFGNQSISQANESASPYFFKDTDRSYRPWLFWVHHWRRPRGVGLGAFPRFGRGVHL